MRHAHEAAAGRVGLRPDDVANSSKPRLRPRVNKAQAISSSTDESTSLSWAALGNHFVRVFTYEGEPIRQVSTKAWYKR
jgi:hypothetical protein